MEKPVEPYNTSESRRKSYSSVSSYQRFDGYTYTYPKQYSERTWEDTTEGYRNPRWKQQVARGVSATTPFVGEKLEHIVKPCYISQENIWTQPGPPQGTYISNFTTYGSQNDLLANVLDIDDAHALSVAQADNLAKEQLVRKIRKIQTTFQGGVFLGELMRSIDLIRNPAQTLRSGLRSYINRLKKDGPKNARLSRKGRTQAVRDTWLEYQLGWAPLVSEIDNGVKAIAESKILSDRGWRPVRAVGVEESSTFYGRHKFPYSASNVWYRPRRHRKNVASVRYIACVDVGTYKAYNPTRMGFAPQDWLPTLWELVPYSFVVDYFVNIGNIINAASLASSGIRWIVRTERKMVEDQFIDWQPKLSKYTYSGMINVLAENIPGKALVRAKTISREPYVGSLVPDLTFSLPNMSTQWLNIAALIHSRHELKRHYR